MRKYRKTHGVRFLAVHATVLLAAMLVVSLPTRLSAQDSVPLEYQVKAACLFNFAKFVEWPANVFPDENSPIIIGVLGKDQFGGLLDRTIQEKKIDRRPLVVQRYKRLEDLKTCHILFVCASEKDRLAKIIAKINGSSTLTVGETQDFLAAGGIINFTIVDKKVRFEINLEAADKASVIISSKLLNLGVQPKPERDKEDS
jgi:hypothetical protein